ncbi:forkhead box protein J1-B-like [Gouania willdenowi]|uniref:forkhead box protein J1-B-like n=1 Tax=Gouania willdenowi TaxID=441366 RepID=UPI001054241C|nr:forkhead box protein J1-B-like [Gouania willdenowi]
MPKAKRFKADRLGMYPKGHVQGSGPAPLDDCLTSLDWLHNFSMIIADPERPSSPGGPLFSRYPRIQMQPVPLVEVDYKTNPNVRPPHSYTSLIFMAMQASEQPEVPLSTIYKWIKENFCYYRHAKPSWQNSIRHFLSLKKCFKNVPRQKDKSGKGRVWQIDPEHLDMFVNRTYRPRELLQGYQDNRGTTRSIETPLDFDILSAACNDIVGGHCSTLEDLDTAAVRVLECEVEGIQQPTGELARCWGGGGGGGGGGGEDVMNHQLSYGHMDLCATTMDDTVNLAELQMPLQYLHQHQDQQHLVNLDQSLMLFSEQSGVGEVQPWVEVTVETETVPPTLDQGFQHPTRS